MLLNPPALVTFNETVKLPPLTYVWTGFCAVALTILPSPNVQFHVVGIFAEKSVNITVSGAVPLLGIPMKSATGRDLRHDRLICIQPSPRANFSGQGTFHIHRRKDDIFYLLGSQRRITDFTSAATPETWGVAMDVPLIIA